MPKIPVTSIEPGMMLAEHVYDRNGRLILKKGLEFEDSHIRALKTWGISTVEIHDKQKRNMIDELINSSEVKKEIIDKLKELFSQSDLNDKFTQSLFQLCLERVVLKKQGGQKS